MPESYSEAAVRHFSDADYLAATGRYDDAGYLIGFAVECAIKHAIQATRPTLDAPHLHLPKLVDGAKKKLQGRQRHPIHVLMEQPGFMFGWTIDVRYFSDGHVSSEDFNRWRQHASRTLAAAQLRRNK